MANKKFFLSDFSFVCVCDKIHITKFTSLAIFKCIAQCY